MGINGNLPISFPYPRWLLWTPNFRTHWPWTRNIVVSWSRVALTFTVPGPDGWHTFSWFTVLASTPRTSGLSFIFRVLKPPLSVLLWSLAPSPPAPWAISSQSLPLHQAYHSGQPQGPTFSQQCATLCEFTFSSAVGHCSRTRGVGDEGINEHMVAIETPVTRLLLALVFSGSSSLMTTWVCFFFSCPELPLFPIILC